ncbi:YdeI/OmpD-associated family protein [Mesorhizobium sp. ZMM04-5]|uniref:YdeI/OmpD-associated family protein n=1 Tax=Mesorhizobium marinum TaxID=3228790 RepID=A0ABV3R108_9HYPH
MTGLRRALHPMPDAVRAALKARGLTAAYEARPPYQQNDYLGWMAAAKREATREKRLAQMLRELERGGVYMNMAWRG